MFKKRYFLNWKKSKLDEKKPKRETRTKKEPKKEDFFHTKKTKTPTTRSCFVESLKRRGNYIFSVNSFSKPESLCSKVLRQNPNEKKEAQKKEKERKSKEKFGALKKTRESLFWRSGFSLVVTRFLKKSLSASKNLTRIFSGFTKIISFPSHLVSFKRFPFSIFFSIFARTAPPGCCLVACWMNCVFLCQERSSSSSSGFAFDGGGGQKRRLFFLTFFVVVLLISQGEGGILTIQDNNQDQAAPTAVFYYRIESNESIPQAILNLPTGSWSFPTEDEPLCVSDDPASCPITEISITNWFVFLFFVFFCFFVFLFCFFLFFFVFFVFYFLFSWSPNFCFFLPLNKSFSVHQNISC